MPADIFGHVPSPVGTIAYWDDDPANIPAGWVVCDGNNGTPNLLDEFVKNVPDGSTTPGATGGQNSFTLSQSQMAGHDHSASGTGTNGSHTQTAEISDGSADGGVAAEAGLSASGNAITWVLESSGNHSHSYDVNSTGSDNSIDNRPTYHELVPIMKT